MNSSNAYSISGFRIQDNLKRGVRYEEELHHHVINGWFIKEPYQTGIMTADECYVLNPLWFKEMADFSNYVEALPLVDLVDDIWLNGHLSKFGIRRYIVPLNGLSIDIAKADNSMISKEISRKKANNNALNYFKVYFEEEKNWFLLSGDQGAENAAPKYRNFFIRRIMIPLYEHFLNLYLHMFILAD